MRPRARLPVPVARAEHGPQVPGECAVERGFESRVGRDAVSRGGLPRRLRARPLPQSSLGGAAAALALRGGFLVLVLRRRGPRRVDDGGQQRHPRRHRVGARVSLSLRAFERRRHGLRRGSVKRVVGHRADGRGPKARAAAERRGPPRLTRAFAQLTRGIHHPAAREPPRGA